ncbi:MAG: hypothetical protein MUE58_07135 [Chitinophagaceae bacterium]|jgi:hypothetical protein|nr:hypothetical protein [Chitinophagaceae bacterium]
MKKLLFFFIVGVISCSEVRLVGAYDEKVDDGIQSIAKQVSAIFVDIDKKIDQQKDWSYPNYVEQYSKIETEIKTLRIRTNGLSKYEIVKGQLTLLDSSMHLLQRDHQSGFVAPGVTDVAVLKKSIAIDESAIAKSLTMMLELQEGLKRKPVSSAKK